MNNIFKTALLAAALMPATACSDFLDETNYGSQSAEEFYATATGYESLITGAYSTLPSVYNNINYFKLSQIGTDLGTQGNGANTFALNQYTVDYMDTQGEVYEQWKNLYTALKNVNAAIGRAKDVKLKADDKFRGIDPDLLSQRVAEAKFLRALYLFEIVRNWGQAPLILEEPTSPSTTARLNGPDEFYTQILTDLDDVLRSSLPEKQPASQYGRASKAAARHLRALVYLTRGYLSCADPNDFDNAFADAKAVIDNSGHSLLPDYAMVHRQANEVNDEIIFPITFSTDNNYNTNKQSMYWLFPYREGWTGLSFSGIYCNDYGAVMPTKYAYLIFDWQKDRRASVTFMSPLNGDPATSIDGRQWGQNWFVGNGAPMDGEKVIYFPLPIESDFRAYTDEEKSSILASTGCAYYNYPSGAVDDCSDDDYYRTGYQSYNGVSRAWLPVWKFKDCNTLWNTAGDVGNGTRDIYLFRLAETYLIAAEAAVKRGQNTDALTYINKVRARAAQGAPQAGLSLYTGTVTLDDIMAERALELLGEAPRWNDLQRTGLLADRVLRYNWDVTHITGGLIKTQLSASTQAKYSLRPIPRTWLNSLSNGTELSNNPGW